MSIRLLENIGLKSEIKSFFRKNSDEILDIILFGSTVRQKEKPNDIDLLVLYKDKKNLDLSYKLKVLLESKNFIVEITDITYKDVFGGSFKARESILSEGYSMVYDKLLSDGFGYMNLMLFKYDLGKLNKSERMRFYYSLYGRTKDQNGVLNELEAVKFSDTVLLCPIENSEKMKEYLQRWNILSINFPVLLPSRIKHIL